ncbi:hypothetical protein ABZX51_002051 [Aspergillus tubingensis]
MQPDATPNVDPRNDIASRGRSMIRLNKVHAHYGPDNFYSRQFSLRSDGQYSSINAFETIDEYINHPTQSHSQISRDSSGRNNISVTMFPFGAPRFSAPLPPSH